MMQPILAHHDMLEGLDFLGLHPVTPLDHALAFAIYALPVFVVLLGLRWARRGSSRRARSARVISGPSSVMTSRSLEG